MGAETQKPAAAKPAAKKAVAKKPAAKKPVAAKKPAPPPAPRTTPDKSATQGALAPQEPIQNLVVTAPGPPPPSLLTTRERDLFNQAVKAAAKHDWSKARSTVNGTRNPLLIKIIEWAYIREPGQHAGFLERTAFLTANPTWPSANDIRRRAEDVIDDSTPTSAILMWFTANPPLSTAGKAAYARALESQGNREKAHALARDAWTTGSFSREDERAFLKDFADILTPEDHWARLDRILYEEQTTAAERMIPRVSADQALVARARIALITSAKNADALVTTVPAALQNDPGLLYDRVKWRRDRGDDDGARKLVPPFAAAGARPDLWWRQRNALARDALSAGNITEAYQIAKEHGSTDALSVSEAEWFAGWIALRFLKDGETALAHFEKVYDSVQTPPSLSRGAYWVGRTMDSLNRPDLAAEWYQRAATYVTTYYGQLALSRLHNETVPQLPQDPVATEQERSAFYDKDLSKALRDLMDVDAKPYQRAFAQALAENATVAVDRQLTAELVNRLSRPDLGVVLARQAARDKITLVQYGFPVPTYSYPQAPERALILAITRQESNFDADAKSGAGARGLMQLMPPTAKALAKQAKQTYSEKKLTDPAFNMRLGSVYLDDLVEDFGGSYILAAAAYNAGPARARQWIRQFGDPRDPSVDAVDWIEQIPFAETRSYVQRVMENVMTYRAVLAGTTHVPRTLETELARHLSAQ